MVLGIGVDILEISRMEKSMRPRFLERYFTHDEIKLIEKKGAKTAAANFCAKEAVAKALGAGFTEFWPKDVEILRDECGAPYVCLYGKAKELAEEMGVISIKISLSHSREYAVAYALLEGKNENCIGKNNGAH